MHQKNGEAHVEHSCHRFVCNTLCLLLSKLAAHSLILLLLSEPLLPVRKRQPMHLVATFHWFRRPSDIQHPPCDLPVLSESCQASLFETPTCRHGKCHTMLRFESTVQQPVDSKVQISAMHEPSNQSLHTDGTHNSCQGCWRLNESILTGVIAEQCPARPAPSSLAAQKASGTQ